MDVLMDQASGAELQRKICFLSRPESYPEATVSVHTVQTHMSCVFLTDSHAYKLKKPVRTRFLDFSTLQARRFDCQEELRLNRRLAPDVYLDIVPLTHSRTTGLRLGPDGSTVDWLVRMRRLPRERMLDQAIRAGHVTEEDVLRVAATLARFYRSAAPVSMGLEEYRQRFARGVRDLERDLSDPRYAIAAGGIRELTRAQLRFLDQKGSMLDQRILARRIVEGHGDLRPEHVFLGPKPLFIDCLEFNREFRILDPADELAYLGLECEFEGAASIGDRVLGIYEEALADHPQPTLIRFYKAYRATLRASLSFSHLRDCDAAGAEAWSQRGRAYLRLAARHCPR